MNSLASFQFFQYLLDSIRISALKPIYLAATWSKFLANLGVNPTKVSNAMTNSESDRSTRGLSQYLSKFKGNAPIHKLCCISGLSQLLEKFSPNKTPLLYRGLNSKHTLRVARTSCGITLSLKSLQTKELSQGMMGVLSCTNSMVSLLACCVIFLQIPLNMRRGRDCGVNRDHWAYVWFFNFCRVNSVFSILKGVRVKLTAYTSIMINNSKFVLQHNQH